MSSGEGNARRPTTLVGGRVALLVESEPSSAFLRKLRETVFGAKAGEAVFDLLSHTGFRNLPSFACVIRDRDSIRLLLRGPFRAVVDSFAGERRTIDGDMVTTWAEHVIHQPREVRLQTQARDQSGGTLVLLFQENDWLRALGHDPADRTIPAIATASSAPAPSNQSAPGGPSLPWKPPSSLSSSAQDGTDLTRRGRGDHDSTLNPISEPSSMVAAPRELVAADADLTEFRTPAVAHAIEMLGDHSGDTVAVPRPPPGAALMGADQARKHWQRPVVQAVRCSRSHSNPPSAAACEACAEPILDRTVVHVERPVLGQLRFSDGLVVALDGTVLLGRNPDREPPSSGAGDAPVSIPLPHKAISRLHAEIRLEDWHVLIFDRQSTNGTFVELPHQEPFKLVPAQPCFITPGTKVDLADAVSFVFEGRTS